jgi:hypothetical protein|tara:strand:+ start:1017 stop:1220 length:204 start_codon:yes stop_codon:yes gene_type:complete
MILFKWRRLVVTFFCLRFFSFFWTLTVLGHVGRWGSKKILGVALTADAEEFFLGKKSRERKKIPHFF